MIDKQESRSHISSEAQTTTTEPVRFESVMSEPVTSESVTSEPVSSEPVMSEPITISTDPITAATTSDNLSTMSNAAIKDVCDMAKLRNRFAKHVPVGHSLLDRFLVDSKNVHMAAIEAKSLERVSTISRFKDACGASQDEHPSSRERDRSGRLLCWIVCSMTTQDGVRIQFEPMERATITVKRLLDESDHDPTVVRLLRKMGKYTVKILSLEMLTGQGQSGCTRVKRSTCF